MAIDIHAYWDPSQMSLDELRRQMKGHGVSRVILSPPCTQNTEPDKSPAMYAVQRVLLRSNVLRPLAETASLSFYNRQGHLRPFWRLFTRRGKPLNKVLVPDNEGLLQAILDYPEMYAWYWINPKLPPAAADRTRNLENPRVMGIKLHAYWHPMDFALIRPVFEAAQEVKKPVYFILGFGWLKDALKLLKEYPNVKIIFGYAGFPYFDHVWRMILPFPNACIDLTSFHIDERGIADALAVLGSERCLFGTDCPYNFKDENDQFDYAQTISRIASCRLGTREYESVVAENARKLLWT